MKMTPTANIQSTGALLKGRACTPAQYRRIAAAQTPRHAHAAGPGAHRKLRPGRVFGARGIGAVLLAVATAVASVWSTPAQAETSAGSQAPRILVGNLDVGDGGSNGIQRTLGAARSGFGQTFTTGPTTGGYALGSLGIQVSQFSDGSTAGDDLRVTVNGVADGGGPGEALCALTHPSSFQAPGVSTFGAPAGEDACPQLAKETSYFVVIEWVEPDAAGALAIIPQTFPTDESAASDEDPGGAAGWSIADVSWYLTVASGARTWTAYETTASFKIELKEAAVVTVAIVVNRPATGLPTISGTAQVGETLTADVSGITDEDGLDNAVFSYQWIGTGGTGTGSAYTLVDADAGKSVKVRVTFEDDGGTRETLLSAATDAVAARPNRAPTGSPNITGTPQVGATLTADVSGIADEDGLENVVYAYQWIANDGAADADIAGATGQTYSPVDGDAGKTLKVRVTFTDDRGADETLLSAATETVAAALGVLSVAAAEASEEEDATLDYAVTLDPAAAAAVTVDYATSDGTATSGADYTAASGTLTFQPGDTSKTVSVAIADDTVDDDGETLTLTLGNASGAEIGVAAATGIIRDDDSNRLTASFEEVPAEHDGTTFVFHVRFSEDPAVSYRVLKDESFDVTGGKVDKARRKDGRNDLREIHVEPSGNGDVTVLLPATTDCAATGAICTADGRPLSNASAATVAGASTASAVVDGPVLTLSWPTPPDGFAPPGGSDFAVRVDGRLLAVASASFQTSGVALHLSESARPGQDVVVDYLGSAMHPLRDAVGTPRASWQDLVATNVTGHIEPQGAAVPPEVTTTVMRLPPVFDGALSVSLAGGAIGDAGLSALAGRTELRRLDLSGNALKDISALSGLSALESLDLSDNEVSDLAPLAGLTELRRLDLSGNRIDELWPISGLPKLEVLLLSGNRVADIGALTHLGRLENLGLAGNLVADVGPLADLWSLRRLDLGGNPAPNLSPLGDLETLVWLRLPSAGGEAPMHRLFRLRWLLAPNAASVCLGCGDAAPGHAEAR